MNKTKQKTLLHSFNHNLIWDSFLRIKACKIRLNDPYHCIGLKITCIVEG